MDSGMLYLVYRNQGHGPITHGFYNPFIGFICHVTCPTVMLSGKHEFITFQHDEYFSSDSRAIVRSSDSSSFMKKKV